MDSLPLAGILVVDLTRAVAGPFCTMNLGDLGARILKIEEPGRGDETRAWGPPFAGEDSAYFLGINRNKESVALDLKSPEGRAALLALCARADIVIENFRPGVMRRFGADYASLNRSDLVYISISGFGQTGPAAGRAGYDMMIQAMSGLMLVSAYPGGPPVKCGFPVADIITSLYAGQAALAALFARERTGQGRYIEIALLEGMLAAMCSVTSSWLIGGVEPAPMGAMQANIAPYQIFRCADGMLAAGALNERQWAHLCAVLGHEEWIGDRRFRTNPLRVSHREELARQIEDALRRGTRAEWTQEFETRGIPCGPVLSISEILGAPLARERGLVVKTGEHETIRNPMRFAGLEPRLDPAPRLAEHTQAVLREFLG